MKGARSFLATATGIKKEQIKGARSFLATATGIKKEQIKGARSFLATAERFAGPPEGVDVIG
jgi:hypothetical protein